MKKDKKYSSWIQIFCIFFIVLSVGCQHLSPLKKNPKMGLIIGPGGARTLSALGVLKVLEEYDIPIHHIVGIGWGAWLAALYAKNKSLAEVRWSFYKLSKSGFFETSILNKSLKPKKVSALKKNLQENFSVKKTKIPFSCPILTTQNKKIWKTQRFLKNAVQSCVGLPPLFKMDSSIKSSPFSIRDSIQHLKSQNVDLVIWINPLGDGSLFSKGQASSDIELFWNEMAYMFQNIEDTPTVLKITPSLFLFSIADFSKTDSIIATGEKAGYVFIEKLQTMYPSFKKLIK